MCITIMPAVPIYLVNELKFFVKKISESKAKESASFLCIAKKNMVI